LRENFFRAIKVSSRTSACLWLWLTTKESFLPLSIEWRNFILGFQLHLPSFKDFFLTSFDANYALSSLWRNLHYWIWWKMTRKFFSLSSEYHQNEIVKPRSMTCSDSSIWQPITKQSTFEPTYQLNSVPTLWCLHLASDCSDIS